MGAEGLLVGGAPEMFDDGDSVAVVRDELADGGGEALETVEERGDAADQAAGIAERAAQSGAAVAGEFEDKDTVSEMRGEAFGGLLGIEMAEQDEVDCMVAR